MACYVARRLAQICQVVSGKGILVAELNHLPDADEAIGGAAS